MTSLTLTVVFEKKTGEKPMKALPILDKSMALIAAFGTLASAAIPDFPTSLDRKIASTLAVTPDEQDLSWITPSTRPQVVARLMQASKDKDSQGWGIAGLLALEDGETVRTLFVKWRAYGVEERATLETLVRYTPTAALLQLLALHIDDTRIYFRGKGDVQGDLAWRQVAATHMIDVIYLRDEFPPATKAWARGLGRDPQKHIQVKQWWEHNKELVAARQYGAATWLPTSAEGNHANTAVTAALAQSSGFARAVNAAAVKAVEAQMIIERTESKPWVVWAVMTSAVASLLWLFLKQRAK